MVRQKLDHVLVEVNNPPISKQEVVLSVDLMHFIGVNFLITVSRDVRFITATILYDQKKKIIWNALRQVMNLYRSKGHTVEEVEFTERQQDVHMILADNEFEMLR